MTDPEKVKTMRKHVLDEHGVDPISHDLATLTFAEHPAYHEYEAATAKYHAILHTIRTMLHVGVPNPED